MRNRFTDRLAVFYPQNTREHINLQRLRSMPRRHAFRSNPPRQRHANQKRNGKPKRRKNKPDADNFIQAKILLPDRAIGKRLTRALRKPIGNNHALERSHPRPVAKQRQKIRHTNAQQRLQAKRHHPNNTQPQRPAENRRGRFARHFIRPCQTQRHETQGEKMQCKKLEVFRPISKPPAD